MTDRFDTLLVANRGEIACRIIRTAQALGLRCVAVHSDADAGAPHVRMADDAVRIGAGPVKDSYLNAEAILAAARQSGAQAIHPGYGFLSENADFARAVAAAGLVFVGPPASAIGAMGDKAAAKRLMIAAGVPCVPGYQDAAQDDATLIAAADRIGYPVMVKASAGGGGRGMRLVETPQALPEALTRARDEARNAFGDDTLILERAMIDPRHVEIQIFADGHGNVIHLGERDCSVQRRHQKVVEEAPCPVMTDDLRRAMGAAAVAVAQAVGYVGAGTVEFLLTDTGQFYFLEMNTRLQVEHPVTEAVTGLDLVAMQIAVAQGEALPLTQDDLRLNGHAIEVRLYAEDPAHDFLPVTGRITGFAAPDLPGLRIDAGIATGFEVSPYYDPMLAKVIAWGPTREAARQKLVAGLTQTAILGLPTNAAFLHGVVAHPVFAAGEATTGFLRDHGPFAQDDVALTRRMAMAAALLVRDQTLRAMALAGFEDDDLIGFASDGGVPRPVDLVIDEHRHALRVRIDGPADWTVEGGDDASTWRHRVHLRDCDGMRARLMVDDRAEHIAFACDGGRIDLQAGTCTLSATVDRPWEGAAGAAGSGRVVAPMPGVVVALDVAPGDRVAQGQTIAVLEAMKMQHPLRAAVAGQVSELATRVGAQLASGALVAVITPDEP
ncbi:MAG: acetyl-CoA carboxylase biotin carboxylase subunit [Paracoccaceae bacterium]